MAVLCFFVWYYPVGQYQNAAATDTTSIRGLLTMLSMWAGFLFCSTFAHLIVAGLPNEDAAGGLATLLSIMLYAFCGILAGPNGLPGFWIFMYRVNPFTYLVSSLMSATLGDAPMNCASTEYQLFTAPANQTCGQYLEEYMAVAGGYLTNPGASGDEACRFCQMENTNQFLGSINVDFGNRWRDFGLLWVYIAFNIVAAAGIYWLARVPKREKVKSA